LSSSPDAKPQRAEKDMASAEPARPQFGVPFFERAYGWVLVRVVAMLPVETLLVRFKRVSDTLLADFPEREVSGTSRVSVKRFVGIEESSRNWSGAMLLEHLRAYVELVRSEAKAFRSPMRHPHPWFGELRVKQWLAFMTLHHMVHVPHMKAISATVGVTDTSQAGS
jgi:hypothetical protein